MNEKSCICVEDFSNGKLSEGVPYSFGDNGEQIVVAIQKLPKGYWVKTQDEEAFFDFDGKFMMMIV